MKFVFASDSFKGTMSSREIHEILTASALEAFPDCKTQSVCIGDGGEGTVEALSLTLKGTWHQVHVHNPLFKKIGTRYYALSNKTAIMEMATASGYSLIKLTPQSIRKANSYGTGEMMVHAIEQGVRKIILGIGGSATNDGGIGALAAFGFRFLDKEGNELLPIAENLSNIAFIDQSHRHPKLENVEIVVISDVNSPLLGKNGATYVYGPQKGADKTALEELEEGMENFYAVCKKTFGQTRANDFPGAGAAGGLGYALKVFLGVKLRPGIEYVLDLLKFDKLIEGADLIITGEGKIDAQSAHGKVVAGVIARARKQGIPVYAIVGKQGSGAEELLGMGLTKIIETAQYAKNPRLVLQQAKPLYKEAAQKVFSELRSNYQKSLTRM